MKTISKSAQGPCDCGAPAIKRLGSGLVCARCWRLERKWAAEVNRQEAGRHRRDMNRLKALGMEPLPVHAAWS